MTTSDRWFRFSLRTIFVLVTLAALVSLYVGSYCQLLPRNARGQGGGFGGFSVRSVRGGFNHGGLVGTPPAGKHLCPVELDRQNILRWSRSNSGNNVATIRPTISTANKSSERHMALRLPNVLRSRTLWRVCGCLLLLAVGRPLPAAESLADRLAGLKEDGWLSVEPRRRNAWSPASATKTAPSRRSPRANRPFASTRRQPGVTAR